MSPTADSYLGVPGYVLFWVLFGIALALFLWRVVFLVRLLRLGKPDRRFDRPLYRISRMLAIPIGQVSNLKHLRPRDLAPLGHAVMFWGLGVFLIGYVVFLGFGAGFGLFSLMSGSAFERTFFSILEVLGIFILAAMVAVIVKRYILKPARLQRDESTLEKVIQPILIGVIMMVVVLHYLLEGFGYAAGDVRAAWPPIGMALADGLRDAGMSPVTASTVFKSLWWLNVVVLLGAMIYTPRSKHLHPLFIFPNVAFRTLSPKGTLRPVDLKNTPAIKRGDIRDFTWKQLLESYACTWCGRCYIACPAQASGKPLSPRELVLGTKEHLLKVGPALLKAGPAPTSDEAAAALTSEEAAGESGADGGTASGGAQQPSPPPPFIGTIVSEDAVWSCTTCRACQEVCPSYNEQMGTIVDLRRHLQLITTTETARETLKNLRVRGHPWRGTAYSRTDWAEDLDVKIVGDDGPAEVLFWVGCTQALEDRSLRVAQAVARLLKEAGVDFAILGEEEMCCGDPARRLGAEHFFQMMAANNIQLLSSYNVKRIVTACPHCFNTLKNEYPELGGGFEVVHHTEMLVELVAQGRLRIGPSRLEKGAGAAQATITYQDPCYLGRYNDLYEPARQLLQRVTRNPLVEMEKSRVNGFCCGGGGGRMWLEESAGTRINSLRFNQARETGAQVIATSCPFCLQMLEDAARAEDAQETLAVKDVAEIVVGCLQSAGSIESRVEVCL